MYIYIYMAIFKHWEIFCCVYLQAWCYCASELCTGKAGAGAGVGASLGQQLPRTDAEEAHSGPGTTPTRNILQVKITNVNL